MSYMKEKNTRKPKKIIPVDWKDFTEEIGNYKDNPSSDKNYSYFTLQP